MIFENLCVDSLLGRLKRSLPPCSGGPTSCSRFKIWWPREVTGIMTRGESPRDVGPGDDGAFSEST